jgi:APA family basic amino acid/polyamine antiporter
MSIWKTKPLSVLPMKPQNRKGLKEHCLQALVALSWRNIAGLFSLTGIAAAEHAGPAVTLSFVLAVGCAFAGLCYAEFASMIPVASAYTYSYATMGEFMV